MAAARHALDWAVQQEVASAAIDDVAAGLAVKTLLQKSWKCRLWFLLPRQSFIHVVSSADPLGLRALFERTLQ